MKLLLIPSAGTEKQLLQAVLTELQSVDGPLSFSLESEPLNLPDGNSFADFFESLKCHRAKMSLHEDDFLGLLTERANHQNWFSAFDEEERNFFVHSEGWDYIMPCRPEIPIAYQVLANFLQKLTYGSATNWAHCAHQHPTGCINDMCGWKPDISLKIRTGDICKTCCETSLNQDSVGENLLEQVLGILNNLRKKALFSYDFGVVGYEDLPSPVAYTKAKLNGHLDSERMCKCLFKHFESLLRTSTHMLGRVFLRDRFEDFLKTHKLAKTPSTGHWVHAIKALSSEEFDVHPEELGLPDDLQESLKAIGREADKGRITEYRNDYSHADESDSKVHKSIYEDCYPYVNRIEKLAKPILASLSPRYVLKAWAIKKGEARVTFYSLVGDHPDFPEREEDYHLEKTELPFSKGIYAYTPNGKWYDLHDSLVFRDCKKCHHMRLLISDGKYYLDNYKGHRFPKPKAVR